jgi:glutaconyl-CoA/methylmalonyl-CoA decarboxylase subunit gamma
MEHLRITVAGRVYDVVVEKYDADEADNPITPAPVARVATPAPATRVAVAPAPAAAPPKAAGDGDATSPLAGLVQAVAVPVGAAVNEGDLIITLEAMKMYTSINAATSGTLEALHVKVGDSVEEGQVLFTIR